MLSKVVRGEILKSITGGRTPAMDRQPVPSMGPLLLATTVPEHVVPGGYSAFLAGEGETVLVSDQSDKASFEESQTICSAREGLTVS